VHLRSVTLRGFKSFVERTELELEPGVTVVVGPNGSGKSNVVDALSWVLGTASPKSLRGGQMADVIFAGAPGRSGLGRAEVAITIDNRDGALPVDFSEVTVSRAIYATGESEYAINRETCRALDVAELLSDTGLGREHHTIVGQGQLDAILDARPEERRGFIDEAAGILKYRKRKERTLRKLSQVDEHTERVTDLLRELRRQLRPLERQAEAARTHQELSQQLTTVRRIRAARELDELQRRVAAADAEDATARQALAAAEQAAGEAHAEVARLEGEVNELTPQVDAAARTHFALANITERLQGLSDRLAERRRGLVEASEEPVSGRDPDELRQRAAAERAEREGIESERAEAACTREEAEGERAAAEQARRAHDQAVAAEARRRAAAREQRLRWEGEIATLRQSVAQAAGEEGRLDSQIAGWQARAEELDADIAAVNAEIQRLDGHTDELAEQVRSCEAKVAKKKAAAEEAARNERELERRRASLEARADAMRAAASTDEGGVEAVQQAAERGELAGVVGPLADQVRIAEGMAPAVAAALGGLGEAVVVDSPQAAHEALAFLRRGDAGRVRLLPVQGATEESVTDAGHADDASDADDATPGQRARRDTGQGAGADAGQGAGAEAGQGAGADDEGRPLAEAIEAPSALADALQQALTGVFAVADLDTATRLATQRPGDTFVTVAGELVGPHGWVGGSTPMAGSVVAAAAADEADAERERVESELLVAHRQVADADRELATAREELEASQAAQQESDAQLTAAAERLGRLEKERQRASEALTELGQQRDELATEAEQRRQRLAELEQQGPPEEEEEGAGPDQEAERLDDALTAAREAEVQARMAERSVVQRLEETDRRVTALEQEADEVEQRLADRERRRQARQAAVARCDELADVAAAALARAQASLAAAEQERARLDAQRAERQQALGLARERQREAADALTQRQNEHHEGDLVRERAQASLVSARDRVSEELGEDCDELLAEARHAEGDDAPLTGGAERDTELEQQEERLVRKIALLGTINPLALEELEQLQERETFLTGQLEDLRSSRADLLAVLEQVDDRIRELFAQAFADVNAQFQAMFPRMFNGGEGRLVLTDPDDLLATGVDVEAKPPGKRIKRLSLLSGGERSLTALALLFAIFAARPSPFYVLDEVEASLDDVNLQRFLEVVGEFRATSQMIVVTHQKRTMEIADTLYGVSMQSDGVSKVIGQRMSEAPATTG